MAGDLMAEARVLHRAGNWQGGASDRVHLDYDGRFLRRKRLQSESGASFLVNLAETISLDEGDAFELLDGRLIEIRADDEPLLEIRGDLTRLAWHIGNRHTPCQIAADRLFIRQDHVLQAMLAQLGATLRPVIAPFRPEGGAYGHGRTMGHDHGPASPLHLHVHSSHAQPGPDIETGGK